MVDKDFYPESMVIVKDRESIASAIKEIIRLDNDDSAYLEKCRSACLVQNVGYYESRMASFLLHIFNEPPEKAKRLNKYGWQQVVREERKHDIDFLSRYRLLKKIDNKLFSRSCQ